MYIDIGERIAGPSLIIYWPHSPPPPPPITKNATFSHWVPYIKKTDDYFVTLLYTCLLCDEVLLPWQFGNPGFDVTTFKDTPNMKKKSYFGFELKKFLSDCFLISHVHRYMWEDSWKARYAQSDHWRSPRALQIAKNIQKWDSIVFPCCT